MPVERSPAFLLYVKDWRSSLKVRAMNFATRGMLLEMLIEQWQTGALPSTPESCACLLGGTKKEWQRAWPKLLPCFSPRKRDGLLVNPKMERVRRERRKYQKSQAESGLRGAQARWNKHGKPIGSPSKPIASPMATNGSSFSSSLSSSPSSQDTRVAGASVQPVQRTATEKERKVPAAARQIPDHENHNDNGNHEERIAHLAYEGLTAEARAELEREAAERLKTYLDHVGQPEERAAMIRRWVVRELENPTVRERCGLGPQPGRRTNATTAIGVLTGMQDNEEQVQKDEETRSH